MSLRIPEDLAKVLLVEQKPLVCPACGCDHLLMSKMAMSFGNTEIVFNPSGLLPLETREIGYSPGVFCLSAECLCACGVGSVHVLSQSWKDGEGASVGSMCTKPGLTGEDMEIAVRKLVEKKGVTG